MYVRGMVLCGITALLLASMPVSAQQPGKASEEQIKKAAEEVRKLAADIDKLNDQLYEAQRRLNQAIDRMDELEGRPPTRRFRDGRGGFGPGGFGPGGAGGFGGDWRDFMRRLEPARPPDPPKAAPPKADPPKAAPAAGAAEFDKRLERLMKELEELRREIRKQP